MQRQCKSDEKYFKKIDYVFHNEAAIREAVLEAKNKVTHSEITNASNLSDPTSAAAIRNLTPVNIVIVGEKILRYPEHWLKVIDATKDWCRLRNDLYYEILRRRYSGDEFKKICAELGVSTDFFYRTLEKIRIHAALVAAYFHLIDF